MSGDFCGTLMEVLMKDENVSRDSDFLETPFRSSGELDFSDVFGGPPRRSSMQEVRTSYGFGETVELEDDRLLLPWGTLKEKPAFGRENAARRRNLGDDFFDDIFRGDESYSSLKKIDRDRDNVFGSGPGSTIMSSDKPSPPKTEAFCTSRPAHFRFSNEAVRGQDEIRNEVHTVYRQSSFSHEASFSSEDRPYTGTSDQKDNVGNLEKDRKSVDGNGDQFHFSIYRWAGRGVPVATTLVDKLKSKDISKIDRCGSWKMEKKPSTGMDEAPLANTKPESLRIECGMKDSESKEEMLELQYSVEEAFYGIPESKSRNNGKHTVVFGGIRQSMKAGVISLDEICITDRTEEEAPVKIEESLESEVMPPHGILTAEVKQPGRTAGMKENKTLTPEEATSDVQTRSKSGRWTATGIGQRENEVDENLEDEPEQCTHTKTPVYRSNYFSMSQETASSSESLCWDSKILVEDPDDPFEDCLLVQELSDDLEKSTVDSESSEEMKASDAKIRQWSVGKKGNIRSLLSTLQYALWSGSGWKPIPLVDLIEANSVKRAYQKALLCLHPDKLQQKGADSHQKYIAENVFGIVQEAWDHFSTLAPL